MPNYFQSQDPFAAVSSGGVQGFLKSMLAKRLQNQELSLQRAKMQQAQQQFDTGLRFDQDKLGFERSKWETEKPLKTAETDSFKASTAETVQKTGHEKALADKAEFIGKVGTMLRMLKQQPQLIGNTMVDPGRASLLPAAQLLTQQGVIQPQQGKDTLFTREQLISALQAAQQGSMEGQASQIPAGAEALVLKPELQSMMDQRMQESLANKQQIAEMLESGRNTREGSKEGVKRDIFGRAEEGRNNRSSAMLGERNLEAEMRDTQTTARASALEEFQNKQIQLQVNKAITSALLGVMKGSSILDTNDHSTVTAPLQGMLNPGQGQAPSSSVTKVWVRDPATGKLVQQSTP